MDEPHPELDFRAVQELRPGPRWRELFEEFWPAYERWFVRRGAPAGTRYADCVRALRRHLPELMPLYEGLVELAGGGDTVARFLSLYRPPPLVSGCSQAVWCRDGEVALVRNYDYAPQLCDGVILLSAWTGRKVIAATDCLWGALDGMNEDGLAIALAFGGSRAVGDGFGAPLLVRYVLETCGTTREAVRALRRVPIHMVYNFAVVDRTGDHRTVFMRPERRPVIRKTPASTNHQLAIEWPEYARFTQTVERHACLVSQLGDSADTLESLVERFLEPPLYRTSYHRASGTLYTAVYRPSSGDVEFRWPRHRWSFTLDTFDEDVHLMQYEPAAAS